MADTNTTAIQKVISAKAKEELNADLKAFAAIMKSTNLGKILSIYKMNFDRRYHTPYLDFKYDKGESVPREMKGNSSFYDLFADVGETGYLQRAAMPGLIQMYEEQVAKRVMQKFEQLTEL